MKRCRITVLKRHFDEELAKEYGSKGIGKCPMLKEGQIFYADYAKPDGFCDEAWKAIYQYVFALAQGSGQFYYAAATTACAPSFSKSNGPTKKRPSTTPRITIRARRNWGGGGETFSRKFLLPLPNSLFPFK